MSPHAKEIGDTKARRVPTPHIGPLNRPVHKSETEAHGGILRNLKDTTARHRHPNYCFMTDDVASSCIDAHGIKHLNYRFAIYAV